MAAASCFPPGLRRANILLFVAALLCVPAAGQEGTLAQPGLTPQSSTYTLSGTVINSVTGEPVRRALVEAGGQMQLTDSQGRFALRGLPAGSYGIGVQKPGFFNEAQISNVPFQPVMFMLGPEASPIVVKLVPEGVISGHIRDENGEPIEAVPVQAHGWRVVNGRRQPIEAGGKTTDEDGQFRIYNLTPGIYYVAAGSAAGPQGIQGGTAEGYPTTYFPGVTQISGATAIQLAAGETAQAGFSLRRTPAYRVEGQVTGYPGAVVNTVQIVENSGLGAAQSVVFQQGTGRFFARLPPGSYEIEAGAFGQAGLSLVGETGVTVAGDVSGITVTMSPTIAIPVVVTTEFDKTLLERGQPPVVVHLEPVSKSGASFLNPETWSRVEGRGANARLMLFSIRPGTYYVDANATGPWYVQSLFSGSTDLFSEPLIVTAGSQVAPLEVVLRDDGASLAGEVRSQGGVVPASVLAIKPDQPRREPRLAASNPQGGFQFDNLPPGEYVLLAVNDIAGLEYADPDALRDYLSQGVHVTLGPKEQKTVSLDVIRR